MTCNTHGGKRRGAGRKKLESPLRNFLAQKYTDAQLEQIKAAALKDGVTVSEYIRNKATRGVL